MFIGVRATAVESARLPAGVSLAPVSQQTDTAQLLAEGGRALAAGELDTAERRFEAVVAADPAAAPGWLGLSEVHERRGEVVAALEAARVARSRSPELPEAALAVGRLLALLGAGAEALDVLAQARGLDPAAPQTYLLSAVLLRDLGRDTEAVELLALAVDRGIGRPDTDSELGLALLATGRHAEARAVAETALGSHPEDGSLELVLGLALAVDPATRTVAADHLKRALALGVVEAGRVHLELGTLLAEQGRSAEAVEHLETAARAMPESPEVYYRLGAALRAVGDVEGAATALAQFQQLHRRRDANEAAAKESGIALNRAQAMASENRLPEALEAVNQILETRPDDAPALALRAKVLLSMQRRDEALNDIARARSLRPAGVEYNYLEGFFLLQLGRPTEARSALLRAVTLDPELGEAHEMIGLIAANEGRPAEAVTHLEKALELGLDNANLRRAYALSLSDLGRSEESEVQMQAYRRLAGQ